MSEYRNVPKMVNGKRRYGAWAGNPKGSPENNSCCIQKVTRAHSWVSSQCGRKRGWGPQGLFCKQHAKQQVSHD